MVTFLVNRGSDMRDDLIEAARRVSEDSCDRNVAALLTVVFAMPTSEMPDEFLMTPVNRYVADNSVFAMLGMISVADEDRFELHDQPGA